MMNMSASAAGLCDFIDASPSPFHVCATVAARLTAAGYTELSEARRWPDEPGRYFTVRAGSLVAWNSDGPEGPFRIVGAHTDSPNLRVKQHPDRLVAGWRVVALEPYGGAWLNSWLDRDLGISGRLSVHDGAGIEHRLVRIDDPILRVPQLAIHLAEDRKSLTLDPQRHVNAVWGVGAEAKSFVDFVAERAGVAPTAVLAADLMTHDLTPSTVIGADADLLSAPRLDNQASCYAGMEALLALEQASEPGGFLPVLVLFDHEEVGSSSDHGAQSDLLGTVLERIVLAAGGTREDFLRRLPDSLLALGGHGARDPPQLSGAARARPPHRGQRRTGAQGAPQPALRHRRTDGRGLRAGLPAGRGRPAALRAPRRPAVRVDDRAAGLGADRHPHRRRRCRAAGDALGARIDGRSRRGRLLVGDAGVPFA